MIQARKVMSGLALGMFLAALDQTVMSSASLTISQGLHAIQSQSWILTTYIATSMLTTPIYGRLSDEYGRRRLFLIALLLFGVGSIFGAIAFNFQILIAARALQGLGAGGLFSLAFAVISDVVPLKERGRYVLFFVLVFGSASILGPVIGGVIASQHQIFNIDGWRWIFLFNLPFVVLALIQSFKNLPSVRHKLKVKFDWLGTILLSTFISLVLIFMDLTKYQNLSILRWTIGLISMLVFFFFVRVEKLAGLNALFPIDYFKNSNFRKIIITSLVSSGAMLIVLAMNPLSLQIVQGESPVIAGSILLAMGFGNLFGSSYANQVIKNERPLKNLQKIGLFLLIVGFLPMAANVSIYSLGLGLFILGCGAGLINQFTSIAAPMALGTENRGSASALNTLFRQIGGLLGVGLAMSALFALWKVPANFSAASLSDLNRAHFANTERLIYLICGIFVGVFSTYILKNNSKQQS